MGGSIVAQPSRTFKSLDTRPPVGEIETSAPSASVNVREGRLHLDLTSALSRLSLAQTGEMGIVTMVLRSGWVVKLVLLLLLLLSVMTWAILFYKWKLIRQAEGETREFHAAYGGEARLSAVAERAAQMGFSPIAAVFHAGFAEYRRAVQFRAQEQGKEGDDALDASGVESVGRTLSRAADTEITRMEKGLPFLATVGSTAPFIGLFGTVWGIMDAFRAIGLVGSASLASVAPGISEALVTTAAGLAAAIPAVVGYNYLVQRIRLLDNDTRSFASEFLNLVERRLRSKG
jgi:biopolymer transport protein TolQ